jgi:PBP1b-binding outer membrane lipoprotein LpoB
MRSIIYILVAGILCIGCNSRPASKPITSVKTAPEKPVESIVTKPEITEEAEEVVENFTALQFNVALGISPQRPRWVLFKNGTYIIFPEGYTNEQIKDKAIEMVSGFSNQNLSVRKSSLAKGWIASTTDGIYTYVSKEDLEMGIVEDTAVKAQALKNIQADKEERRVIHINSKKN